MSVDGIWHVVCQLDLVGMLDAGNGVGDLLAKFMTLARNGLIMNTSQKTISWEAKERKCNEVKMLENQVL